MEDGNVVGIDIAGVPRDIIIQRVIERTVGCAVLRGGKGQQFCACLHVLRDDEGFVGGDATGHRVGSKVGFDATCGIAKRPSAEPTITTYSLRRRERAVQRETVVPAYGQGDVARFGIYACGQSLFFDVYYYLGGLMVEGERSINSIIDIQSLFTAQKVALFVTIIFILFLLYAPRYLGKVCTTFGYSPIGIDCLYV